MTKKQELELPRQEKTSGKKTGIRHIRHLLHQALTATDLKHGEKQALADQFLQATICLNRPLPRLGRSATEIRRGAIKLSKRYPNLNWPALEQTILLLSHEYHQSLSLTQLQMGSLASLTHTSPEPASPVLPGLFAKQGQPLLEFFAQLIKVPDNNLSLFIPGRDGQIHPFESAETLKYSFRYQDIFNLYEKPEKFWFLVKVKNSNINFALATVFDQADPETPLGSLTLIPKPETTNQKLGLFPEKPLEIISDAQLKMNWIGSQDFKQDRLLALFKSTLDC